MTNFLSENMKPAILCWWSQRQNALIQSVKTLIIIIFTWIVLGEYNEKAQVLGTFVAGFLSLLRFGRDGKQQGMTIVFSALGMMISSGLALQFYQMPWLNNSLFVVLVFIAFYLRRFGGRFFMPPLFVLMLYIVVQLLPRPPVLSLWLGILLATGIVIFFTFMIVPIDDRKQLNTNMQLLFKLSSEVITAFIAFPIKTENPNVSENVLSRRAAVSAFKVCHQRYMKMALQLRKDNSRLVNEYLFLDKDPQVETFYDFHYRMTKTFGMLFESCQQLIESEELNRQAQEDMLRVAKELLLVLALSKISHMQVTLVHIQHFKREYAYFSSYPFDIDLTKPESIHIFNFSLSIKRLIETLAIWESDNA
ncbi:hypothetical protein [Shewanella surugensis]|uniref:FUSC family protein n=1 Tax=Shewanella surugensis TaxID=212020 RepID=A0ABT0LBR4_9GAMM|nr:hypothetical protein [Shewanella surugensis]MCL1124626.1 hypothetical protein [Shewanella surugensis]